MHDSDNIRPWDNVCSSVSPGFHLASVATVCLQYPVPPQRPTDIDQTLQSRGALFHSFQEGYGKWKIILSLYLNDSNSQFKLQGLIWLPIQNTTKFWEGHSLLSGPIQRWYNMIYYMPKDIVTCRPWESNKQPSDNKTLALTFYQQLPSVKPMLHKIILL